LATKYFIGGTTGGFNQGFSNGFNIGTPDKDWHDGNNWSLSSGGAGGAGVPGASDDVIFDNNSPDCQLTANGNCRDFTITATCPSDVDLNGFTLDIEDAVSVDVAGGASITPNLGTVLLSTGGSRTVDFGGEVLYNLTHSAGDSVTYVDTNVSNEFRITTGYRINGTINVQGDVRSTTSALNSTQTGRVILDGTGAQEVYVDKLGGSADFPAILVNKGGGVATLYDRIVMPTAGATAGLSSGLATLDALTQQPTLVSERFTHFDFNGARIWRVEQRTNGFTMQYMSDVGVVDQFYLATVTNTTGGNKINLEGDLRLGDTGALSSTSVTIEFMGTGDQNVINDDPSDYSLPWNINKPSGTLFLGSDIIRFSANTNITWTYTQGTVDPGTATLDFNSQRSKTINLTAGDFTVYNLKLGTGGGYATNINTNKFLVENVFTLQGGGSTQTLNGSIEVGGNIINTRTGGTTNGTFNVTINGSGDQTIDGNAANFHTGAWIVNKPSGSLKLISDLSLNDTSTDLTVTQGTLDLDGFDITVSRNFTVNDGLALTGAETITVGGAFTLNPAASSVLYHGAATAVLNNLATAFFNLNLDRDTDGKTIQTTAGTTITLNGEVTTNGTNGTPTLIRSTISGTQAKWNLVGTQSLLNAVDVQDNDASGGLPFYVFGSVDSGNTINWFFTTLAGAVQQHAQISVVMPQQGVLVGGAFAFDMMNYHGPLAAGGGGVFPGPGSTYSIFTAGFTDAPGGGNVIAGYNHVTSQFDILTLVPGASPYELVVSPTHVAGVVAAVPTATTRSSPWPVTAFGNGSFPANQDIGAGANRKGAVRAGNILYASETNAVGGTFVQSSADGLAWAQLGIQASAAPAQPRCLYVLQSGTILMIDDNGCLRSNTGGASWTTPALPGLPVGTILGAMFSEITAGGTIFLLISSVSGAFQGSRLYRSIDDGVTWALVYDESISGPYTANWIDSSNVRMVAMTANIIVVSYNYWVMRSTDGGLTWADTHTDSVGFFGQDMWEDTKSGDIYVMFRDNAGNTGGRIIRSADNGATWAAWFNSLLDICGQGGVAVVAPRAFAFGGSRR